MMVRNGILENYYHHQHETNILNTMMIQQNLIWSLYRQEHTHYDVVLMQRYSSEERKQMKADREYMDKHRINLLILYKRARFLYYLHIKDELLTLYIPVSH